MCIQPSGTTNFFTTEILDALIILHMPSPEEERVSELNFYVFANHSNYVDY